MLEGYAKNEDGLIYQLSPERITYDPTYVDKRYNTYGELNGRMSHLRYGFLTGAIGQEPTSVLDVGYGNGAFLELVAKRLGPGRAFGTDVSGYPIPEGAEFVTDWTRKPVQVITFFDVLEHFDDPYMIKDLQPHYVYISLPQCHYNSIEQQHGEEAADRWFESWKHRRPNEHIWHFSPGSMVKFARRCGYEPIAWADVEDVIRTPPDHRVNSMSVILRRSN